MAITDKETQVPSDIFIVAHGSKSPIGQAQLRSTIQLLKDALPDRRISFGFLELAKPNIEDALHQFVDEKTERITIIPLVLLAAKHEKSDIAGAVEMARSKYPNVQFNYGRDLGVSLALNSAFFENATIDFANNTSEFSMLLVGRGSSDPDANSDLFKVGRLLSEVYEIRNVEPCFISLTYPQIPEGLNRLFLHQTRSLLVVPYFLFAGVLVDRITEQVNRWNKSYPNVSAHISKELGPSATIVQIIIERIHEAEGELVRMSCDRCIYRERTKGFEDSHEMELVVEFPSDHHH